MTERDYRNFRRYVVFIPLISIVAMALIQWGTLSANSVNTQKSLDQQRIEYDRRFEKIEREKADAALVEIKINTLDWKLDLIMRNFNIPYTPPPVNKTNNK